MRRLRGRIGGLAHPPTYPPTHTHTHTQCAMKFKPPTHPTPTRVHRHVRGNRGGQLDAAAAAAPPPVLPAAGTRARGRHGRQRRWRRHQWSGRWAAMRRRRRQRASWWQGGLWRRHYAGRRRPGRGLELGRAQGLRHAALNRYAGKAKQGDRAARDAPRRRHSRGVRAADAEPCRRGCRRTQRGRHGHGRRRARGRRHWREGGACSGPGTQVGGGTRCGVCGGVAINSSVCGGFGVRGDGAARAPACVH
eukprot:366059-Chlamydomonas_euryale.AAC.4